MGFQSRGSNGLTRWVMLPGLQSCQLIIPNVSGRIKITGICGCKLSRRSFAASSTRPFEGKQGAEDDKIRTISTPFQTLTVVLTSTTSYSLPELVPTCQTNAATTFDAITYRRFFYAIFRRLDRNQSRIRRLDGSRTHSHVAAIQEFFRSSVSRLDTTTPLFHQLYCGFVWRDAISPSCSRH